MSINKVISPKDRNKILFGAVEFFIGRSTVGGVIGANLPALNDLDSDGLLKFAEEGTDAVQEINLGGATSLTFTLSYNHFDGRVQITDAIEFDATNTEIADAINSLSLVGSSGVSVATAAGSGDWDVTFDGANTKGRPQILMTVVDSTAGGTGVTISSITTGVADWMRVGNLDNGVDFEYEGEWQEKFVDDESGPIMVILIRESAKFIVELAQRDLVSYATAIGGMTLTTQQATASVPGILRGGIGGGAPPEVQLAMQGVNQYGLPRLWYVPACKITGSFTDKQDRNTNNIKLEALVMSDQTQPQGERMVQIFDMSQGVLA